MVQKSISSSVYYVLWSTEKAFSLEALTYEVRLDLRNPNISEDAVREVVEQLVSDGTVSEDDLTYCIN